MKTILAILILAVAPLSAAIEGVVRNGTTGRPEAGVSVALVKLEQGMVPVGSARSDAGGKFRFPQDVTGTPLMLRAEFEGVTYNQMIPPGSRTGDVGVTVYGASKTAIAPEQHILLLEPSGREMIVNEFFLYRNQAQPPVTYMDARQGTLRFYLPAAAKRIVQVSATGPGGMPLRAAAEKSGETDIYKVGFPIKPGENRIELTYLMPYQSPLEFDVRTLYKGLTTRVAAPKGVALGGEGLEPLPENPQIKASIYALPKAASFKLSIAGEGRLARDREEGGEGSGETISVIPAAVHNQLWVILGFAGAILALGFYGLYTASGPKGPAPKRKS